MTIVLTDIRLHLTFTALLAECIYPSDLHLSSGCF